LEHLKKNEKTFFETFSNSCMGNVPSIWDV
jgi:hypothetical protein